MGKADKEEILAHIAGDSLKCIESVAKNAEDEMEERHRPTSGASRLANTNTFNDHLAAAELRNIDGIALQELATRINEPIIARVHCADEDGKEETIFFTRGGPVVVHGFRIASYRSELGRIASFEAGEEGTFRLDGEERDLEVENVARMKPERENGIWDARDTEIDIQKFGPFTIKSLRGLLIKPETETDEDGIAALWDDESSENVEEGLRRAILTHMGLRDQPILDRKQDRIFRMPIDSRCFLSGPPGTGKTTTLIRRLGQKTDSHALEEREIRLVEQVEAETNQSRQESWLLFSPTELLRQYVKEAFAREGLAASDRHIRTWEEFRRELARGHLRLLRTSSGSGQFVERRMQKYLQPDPNDAAWHDDFREYLDKANVAELVADAEELAKNEAAELQSLGERLVQVMQSLDRNPYAQAVQNVAKLIPEIQEAISERKNAIDHILTLARNKLTYENRNFPDQLRDQISRQIAEASQEAEEEEDNADAEMDDDEEQVVESRAGRPVSRRHAMVWFERAVKSLARAKASRRQVRKESKNGILLSWLGEERWPPKEDIARLGQLLTEQRQLRKFAQLERQFLRNVASKYKQFRNDRAKEQRWYQAVPEKSSDIYCSELDLLVLATLQIANELLGVRRAQDDGNLPATGILGAVRHLQRAQILVDEATDFSRVQLASMYELAHPSTRSFFMCGDINQRLTSWGIKSNKELEWINSTIERKIITVPYRQSRRLVKLAEDIAGIGGARMDEITLPKRVDSEGVKPVWQSGLAGNPKIADWLTQRIHEIDQTVEATTIAVLVNEEEQVEPLAIELNDRLEEINLKAAACKDGKVVGNDHDVRVFSIQHIKGLEFEAVFFVGLDEIVEAHPDLFTKYLYVGATRAATYLGITFHGDIPSQVEELRHHFSTTFP